MNDKKITNRGGQRDRTIDFIKGAGIVLMVYGHADGSSLFTDFLRMFHMAIFFIASGYLLNLKYSRDIHSYGRYVKKKLKGLWLPYVGFNTVYLLLHNIFLKLNIYTSNPSFMSTHLADSRYLKLTQSMGVSDTGKEIIKALLFSSGSEQLAGAMWFFNTLFFALITYMTVQYILYKMMKKSHTEIAQLIIALLFLLTGFFCQRHGITIHGMDKVFSYYCLLHIGYLFHKYDVFSRIYYRVKPIYVLIMSITVLLLLYHHGIVSLARNIYPNPTYLIVASVAGWTMLYSLGMMLQRSKIITGALQYISIHSVPIVGMHFLCFKIVSLIAVLALGMKMYMIAAFPVLELPGAWWLFYTVVGILVPLLVDRVWIMVRRRVLARLNIPD